MLAYKRAIRLSALILVATACFSDRLLSPDEFNELLSARAKWTARPFADYTYEIQQFCFCPHEIVAWNRVTVRGGAVVAVVPVETDPHDPPPPLTYWQPIDSLFARILQSADQGGHSGPYSDIVVTYDAQLGFPTRIEWREKRNVADAAATYNIRNVVPQ